ncbi:MAG: hypothetical protein NWR43_00730 [Alphaproteobacteria bacterium]|nr:hypothetical protein [Alphaproteobacteria bacterium]
MNFKSLYSLSLFLNVTYATACNTWQFPFEEDANTPNIRSNSTGDLEDDKILQGKERTIPLGQRLPLKKESSLQRLLSILLIRKTTKGETGFKGIPRVIAQDCLFP